MSFQTLEVHVGPEEILNNPLLNKGTGFTLEEREELHLHGLIPPHVSTIEEQVRRRYLNFCAAQSEINKYIFLKNLQDRNEVLFYRLVLEHCEEMLPYIYTPTVGEASLDYSNLYYQNRGIYFSYALKDKIEDIVANISNPHIDAIVMTDGSRILGLGDLGIGGMAIPIGKLALYTVFGGIYPGRTLPVLLDVGTNNEELLSDPLYLGSRHKRVEGKEYDAFVERVVQAIKKRYPHALLQWEDFSKDHARVLLDRYQKVICSFNDDIQGTAAVVLAGILAALKATGESLINQRIAILGGGSAGLGIARYLALAMKSAGCSEEEIYSKFYIVDIHGLIHTNLQGCDPHQMKFAQDFKKVQAWRVNNHNHITLEDVVEHARPTILLGVSAQPGTFTRSLVEKMTSYCKRPIIFPLSNPTSRAEASSKDLVAWSKGNAIIATGSPSENITYQNEKVSIAQCNNVYIFPGVALGIIASKMTFVTDEIFLKAAYILSEHSPMTEDPKGTLFPGFDQLREVSRKIGIEIVKFACEKGLANQPSSIEKLIDANIWYPKYPMIRRRKIPL